LSITHNTVINSKKKIITHVKVCMDRVNRKDKIEDDLLKEFKKCK